MAFKTWDHVGTITPIVDRSVADYPHGEFKPAPWLPVQRYDQALGAEDWYAISRGKVLAFDLDGYLVPAGYAELFGLAGGTTVLTYTANDVTWGTIDLSTGVAVTAATSYTVTQLTTALRLRGIIRHTDALTTFIKPAVGYSFDNILAWAGGDGWNPNKYNFTNYNKQNQVAICTERVIAMPLLPANTGSVTIGTTMHNLGTELFTPNDFDSITAGEWYGSTTLAACTRYSAEVTAGDDVVAVALAGAGIHLAKDTSRTPITFAAAQTGFARERNSIAELVVAGDYWIDYEVGMIFCFEADGNAVPANTAGATTYYWYTFTDGSAPAAGQITTYACAYGDLKPGDFVTFDRYSNYVPATACSFTITGGGTSYNLYVDQIIGQVLTVESHPRDYLQHVRTQYTGQGTANQMPGSASGGYPTAITYSGAASLIVTILVRT